MQSIRSFMFGPTPEEQRQKCNSLVRKNARQLDRDIQNLSALETKTKNLILQASKRGERNPSQAAQAQREIRTFAREMVRMRRQKARLATSKAQLHSVQMQVNEAFALRRIEGSIQKSTGIMKDVNRLLSVGQLTGTMRELSQELVKAGIIEEMVGDSMPEMEEDWADEEEAETEVEKVLTEVLKGRLPAGRAPEDVAAVPSVPEAGEPVEEEEDQEEMLAQMRGRLEALKS